jgi:ribose transport system substrate-binding protein
MLKKALLVLLVLCFIGIPVGLFAGTEKKAEKPVIAFSIMDYSITFLMDLLAGARQEAEKLGIELRDYNSQFDTMKQINNIEDSIAQKADCIMVHPVESGAVSPAIISANEAGIPVVAVDIKPDEGDLFCFVASDNIKIGKTATEQMIRVLEKKYGEPRGKIVIIGNDMISSMRLRKIGLKEVLGDYPMIKIVDEHDFVCKVPNAIECVENVLQKYPKGELDFIMPLNATHVLGTISAVTAAGRFDVNIMGIDRDEDILKAIADPKNPTVGTVIQSPADIGRIGVRMCAKAIKGESAESDFVEVPVKLLTKDNVKEFLAQAEEESKALDPYRVK